MQFIFIYDKNLRPERKYQSNIFRCKVVKITREFFLHFFIRINKGRLKNFGLIQRGTLLLK